MVQPADSIRQRPQCSTVATLNQIHVKQLKACLTPMAPSMLHGRKVDPRRMRLSSELPVHDYDVSGTGYT